MNFEEFAAGNLRNHWIREPGLRIYVRRSFEGWTERMGDFQIADIFANKPGKGSLTSFLDKYEKDYVFYFENILNERLTAYLLRRGYVVVRDAFPPCLKGQKHDPHTANEIAGQHNTG